MRFTRSSRPEFPKPLPGRSYVGNLKKTGIYASSSGRPSGQSDDGASNAGSNNDSNDGDSEFELDEETTVGRSGGKKYSVEEASATVKRAARVAVAGGAAVARGVVGIARRRGSMVAPPSPRSGSGSDVWVQQEVDSHPVYKKSGGFGGHLAGKLISHGIDAALADAAEDRATAQLGTSRVAIFLLSEHFFSNDVAIRQMRTAVDRGVTCVIVKLPDARWGDEHEHDFPENAFNPFWTPHLPELAPAFAEIAVAWEVEYAEACELELLRRVAACLEKQEGRPVVNISAVSHKLSEAEADKVDGARRAQPTDVELSWDWGDKVFDVFLSHKITDAKDVVLTWYNALAALDYYPFLDRLNLDMVDKIPTYVGQSVNFMVAVTSHLHESYWCAVELCKAVDLHAQGLVNILLVPVQGHRWGKLPFPTPEIMMTNFGKWLPNVSEETIARVRLLYGGSEYTRSRTVQHTLLHYKSFERHLIARCGTSIKQKRQIDELAARGGVSLAEQSAALVTLVTEANAMMAQLKRATSYLVVLETVTGGADSGRMSAHAQLHDMLKRELMVAEVVDGRHVPARARS